MKTLRTLCAAALMAACASGCSSDSQGPEVLTLDDLTGTWQATSHLYTNKANPAESFDLIANGGETRITVLSGGKARTWVTIGTFSDEWDAQLSLDGNTLVSTPADASRGTTRFTFTLSGGVLTLSNDNDSFDFTLQGGTEVPASLKVALAKQ